MAVRRHVTAARNTTAEAFRSAVAPACNCEPGKHEIHEAGGWVWRMDSVWHVSAAALDAGIQALPGPALRFTTEDGSRWYLRLFIADQPPCDCLCEFALLEELLHGTSESGPAEDIEHFEMLGHPVPPELRARAGVLSQIEWTRALVDWQVGAVLAALQRYRLPHDVDAIRSVLTAETVSAREMETDIGNLPRLLVALGFGPEAKRWLENCLAEEDAAPPSEPPDFAAAVLDRLHDADLCPIDGGPIVQPIDHAGQVFRIPWFCDRRVEAALDIAYPPKQNPRIDWETVGWITVRRTEGGAHIGFRFTDNLVHPTKVVGHARAALHKLLKGLPDGTVLELAAAGPHPSAGRHRYRGILQRGNWRITHAHPRVSRQTLATAIDLVRIIDKRRALPAETEEAAERVLEALRHLPDSEVHPPTRRGTALHLSPQQWFVVARWLFRRHFDEAWPLADERDVCP